jgi:low temperature requirement protein LtrA
MRWPRRLGARAPGLSAELREREAVKPLELFFDLVFVLGFTQCTALMTADVSWTGSYGRWPCSRCCGGRGPPMRG